MNRYLMIRRLRGPLYLLLLGVIALLSQLDIISWHHSWPFFLILAGVLMLAERGAYALDGNPYAEQQPDAFNSGFGSGTNANAGAGFNSGVGGNAAGNVGSAGPVATGSVAVSEPTVYTHPETGDLHTTEIQTNTKGVQL